MQMYVLLCVCGGSIRLHSLFHKQVNESYNKLIELANLNVAVETHTFFNLFFTKKNITLNAPIGT